MNPTVFFVFFSKITKSHFSDAIHAGFGPAQMSPPPFTSKNILRTPLTCPSYKCTVSLFFHVKRYLYIASCVRSEPACPGPGPGHPTECRATDRGGIQVQLHVSWHSGYSYYTLGPFKWYCGSCLSGCSCHSNCHNYPQLLPVHLAQMQLMQWVQ